MTSDYPHLTTRQSSDFYYTCLNNVNRVCRSKNFPELRIRSPGNLPKIYQIEPAVYLSHPSITYRMSKREIAIAEAQYQDQVAAAKYEVNMI